MNARQKSRLGASAPSRPAPIAVTQRPDARLHPAWPRHGGEGTQHGGRTADDEDERRGQGQARRRRLSGHRLDDVAHGQAGGEGTEGEGVVARRRYGAGRVVHERVRGA